MQTRVDNIVAELSKQREVDCEDCNHERFWTDEEPVATYTDGEPWWHAPVCYDCGDAEGNNTTGKVSNPKAQAAWEVMTKECPGHGSIDHRGTNDVVIWRWFPCTKWWACVCGGKGRIPHDVSILPDGAIRGMLEDAVRAYGWSDRLSFPIYLPLESGQVRVYWDDKTATGNTKSEALAEAFLKDLQEVTV